MQPDSSAHPNSVQRKCVTGISMEFRHSKLFLAVSLMILRSSATALGDTEGGLAAELQHHYRLATTTISLNGEQQFVPGAVLYVQRKGILAFGEKDATMSALCASTYQSGILHTPKPDLCVSLMPGNQRTLSVGEPVSLTAISIDQSHDTLSLRLVAFKKNRDGRAASNATAEIHFQFSSGALGKMPAASVENVIGQVLVEQKPAAENKSEIVKPESGKPVDSSTAKTKDSGTPSPSPAPPAKTDNAKEKEAGKDPAPVVPVCKGTKGNTCACAPPPPCGSSAPDMHDTRLRAITLGLTTDQVKVILGQPVNIADFGTRILYAYPHIEVVFTDGRVTQIQQL